MRWLKGLQAQYTLRRDTMIDALLDQSHAGIDVRAVSSNGSKATYAWTTGEPDEKFASGKHLLSFVPPQGGMFVWLRVHLSNHPAFHQGANTSDLLIKLWETIAEHRVLVAPGNIFNARTFGTGDQMPPVTAVRIMSESGDQDEDERGHELFVTPEGDGYFRISFSSASKEDMIHAARVLGREVQKFFHV